MDARRIHSPTSAYGFYMGAELKKKKREKKREKGALFLSTNFKFLNKLLSFFKIILNFSQKTRFTYPKSGCWAVGLATSTSICVVEVPQVFFFKVSEQYRT